MRFIIFVIDSKSGSAEGAEMEAITAFNNQLRSKGQFVMAAGIAGPAKARVIDDRQGRHVSSPGSLFDSDEFYSGFWVVEAADESAAMTVALGGSRACNRRVELRPFL